MSNGSQEKLQQVIAGHPQGGSASKSAADADTTIVNFQDWLFFGSAPNVFAQVGITPVSQSIAIQYGIIVIQTPSNVIVADASFNTTNAQGGWAVNLAADTGIYDIGAYGNQVEVWAFAQAVVGGQLQSQYSATQTYTVS